MKTQAQGLKAQDTRQPLGSQTIRHALGHLPAKGSVRKAGDEFVVRVRNR
jgi:hypothetical protein